MIYADKITDNLIKNQQTIIFGKMKICDSSIIPSRYLRIKSGIIPSNIVSEYVKNNDIIT